MTRVFVLADSEQSALDLATLLSEDERFEVVGALDVSAASLSVIREARPDVLLASRVSVDEIPDASLPAVLLTNEASAELGCAKFGQGSSAAPHRAARGSSLPARGGSGLNRPHAGAGRDGPEHRSRSQHTAPMPEALTPRETQVLAHDGEGLANKEIAEQLGISDHTAKFHVASILGKLQAGSRTEAVTTGIRTGLIPIDRASKTGLLELWWLAVSALFAGSEA